MKTIEDTNIVTALNCDQSLKSKADTKSDVEPETETSEEKGEVLFWPPLYKQRYQAVLDILNCHPGPPLSTVADLGCAELKFVSLLKDAPGVTKVIGLDIDQDLITWKSKHVGPLLSDYIYSQRRGAPLDLEVYSGSVADHDARFKGTIDAVTMIELVEHLHKKELNLLPDAVFGHIHPRLVVVTTPNSEYNVLFPDYSGEMRHWDHKFEWTREEFRHWAEEVVERFSDYSVSFSGVGWTEGKEESHGPCSQIAVFVREDKEDVFVREGEEGVKEGGSCCEGEEVYELVERYSFPYHIDNRTLEEKILEESRYYLKYRARDKRLYGHDEDEDGDDEERIELESLLDYSYINKLTEDVEVVRSVLVKAGWKVENGEVFVKVDLGEEEESEEEYSEDFNEDVDNNTKAEIWSEEEVWD